MTEPSGKPNLKPLDYGRPEASPTGRRVFLGTALGLGILLVWALYELQRMPYRPPADMSTLLGGGEILAVRFTMAAVGAFWVIGLRELIRTCSRS